MPTTEIRDRRPPTDVKPERDWLFRAWLSVILLPVFFFIAFAVAEVLYSATGHDPSTESPPLWADLVAVIPAGVVFLVPCAAAVVYGRRAYRAGKRSGAAPAVIGALAALGFIILSVLGE